MPHHKSASSLGSCRKQPRTPCRATPLEVAPPLNFYTPQRMIDITVLDDDDPDEFGDPKKQVFTMHYNILAHFSLSFRKTLKSDPKCNEITLHGCESTFGLLQNWFYTQKIQGSNGGIKLLEYAKLWKLAKDLGITDLATPLIDIIDTIKPGEDHEEGNTVQDFQTIAYTGTYRSLEDMAVEKTLSAMNALNVDRIFNNMPILCDLASHW
ncbi:hypothetical protein BKA65DRAFT_205127 [Rhexocercosporidium sp. MPI-PUGE-AT-0058]|nr:hypothetical protein BKA65DRAFT_205127 [Rhexocercosporidium sp. MPI-PUGE-AT-0058]